MDQGTQRLIRRHNAQMRDLIVRDIDALENKLNVKRQVHDMADNAVETVKGKLGMNNSNPNEGWLDFVRHNAGPLAAVGLGGAVLAKNVQNRVSASHTTVARTDTTPYFDPTTGGTEDSGGGLRDQVGSKVSDARSTVSDATTVVGERATDMKDTVAVQAMVAKDAVVDRIPSRDEVKVMARDHSQLVGVAALAVGAVAGVLTPRSKAEERKLAPVQNQVRDKASELVEHGKEMAQDKVEAVTEAVSSGVETVKEELDSSGEDDGFDSGGTGSVDTGFEDTSSAESEADMPDLTRPNRITGTRLDSYNGVPGVS